MKVNIKITQAEFDNMYQNLFPPNSKDEHCGFAIAATSVYKNECNLLIRHYLPSDESCFNYNSGVSVSPKAEYVQYSWLAAKQSNCSIIKIHTHPFSGENVWFSSIDDNNDMRTFPCETAHLGPGPHASIVLGKNSIAARYYDFQTQTIQPINCFTIIGDTLKTVTIN